MTKYDTLRVGSTELVRINILFSDISFLPDKLIEFYNAIAENAKKGALDLLGKIAKSHFEAHKQNRSFFKRFNYFFTLSAKEPEKNIAQIEIKITIRRGGEVLYEKQMCHFWETSHLVMLSQGKRTPGKISRLLPRKIVKK